MKNIIKILFFCCLSLFILKSYTLASDNNTYVYNRYDMHNMLRNKNNSNYKVPKLENIEDLSNAVDENGEKINVLDSWSIKNSDNKVITYKGYNIVFAMGGKSKLYLFYKKANKPIKKISDWKFAGRVFSDNDKINFNNKQISMHKYEEWSGSTIKMGNKLKMFYTISSNKQMISSVNLNLNFNKNKVSIKKSDNRVLFEGDGNIYQTEDMRENNTNVNSKTDAFDDHGLRDPQFIRDKNHNYLLFSGNTGFSNDYQGINNFTNNKFFGGNKSFRKYERNYLSKNPFLLDNLQFANATIGMLELDKNYKVKKIMKPLVQFNSITDEIERPDIFKYKGRWYLFGIVHGFHLITNKLKGNNEFLIGFSSKNINGLFRPLNNNGIVLYNNKSIQYKDYTYSYSPTLTNKGILITSFAGNFGGDPFGKFKQTFAPSYTLDVNKNKTSTKKSKILAQGALEK